jgi:hypothetical protein
VSVDIHANSLPASPTATLGVRDVVFFAAALLFIYTQVFQFPFTPIYFEGDHLVPVSNAMRMLDGEVIYRDFFHLAPPGTELIYEALFSVFGVRIWLLNGAVVLLGAAQAWFLWYFGRKTLSGYLVYLPAAIYLVIGFRQFDIDGSYRLFSVLCVLGAVAMLMGGRSARRLVAAGVLCGLASFFVQTRGLVGMAGIGAFMMWESYRDGFDVKVFVRDAAILSAAFLVTALGTHAYFLWQAGADNYYFCLVRFLYAHYPNDPLAKTSSIFSDLPDFEAYRHIYSPFGAVSRYARFSAPVVFYYLLIPLVYIAFWIYRWRSDIRSQLGSVNRNLVLLSVVGLFLALGVSVPSAGRFNHVAIPGVVLLVFLASRFNFARYVLSPVMVGLVLLGLAYAVQRQVATKYTVEMPGGRAAFLNNDIAERYRLITQITRPGDVFFEAHHPSFYFPLHLKNPTPMYLLRDSNYTPVFQVDGTVRALEKSRPQYIVWQGTWSKPAEQRAVGDNLQPLWDFVRNNYEFEVEYIDHGEYTLTSERRIQLWRLRQ